MDTENNILNDVTRVAIYVKDIELLTGRTERYARTIMQKIRQRHGKAKDQLVSVSELAAYLGLPLQDVISQLKLRR